jgi:hypothetical protein
VPLHEDKRAELSLVGSARRAGAKDPSIETQRNKTSQAGAKLLMFERRGLNPLLQVPRRFITDRVAPLQLLSARPRLRVHDVNGGEPNRQRQVGVMKNGSDGNGVLVLAIRTPQQSPPFPALSSGFQAANAIVITSKTAGTRRPSQSFEVRNADFVA